MPTAMLASTVHEQQPPTTQLPGGTIGLLLGYCAAIDECRGLPVISVWPLVQLSVKFYGWIIALYLVIVVGILDIFLLLLRAIFRWPKHPIGAIFYRYIARPFRSAWAGEIPWFRAFRVRYLTRLLLCYHARRRVGALHDALNRSQLEMLGGVCDAAALPEAESLERAIQLFGKITENRLTVGPLVALGPLLTAFSIVTQKVVIPIVHNVIDYIMVKLGLTDLEISAALNESMVQNTLISVVLVVLYAIWLLASAWMDKRAILVGLGVPQLEHGAFASARLIPRRGLPFDLIALVIVSLGLMGLPGWLGISDLLASGDMRYELVMQQYNSAIRLDFIFVGALAIGFGLVAFLRRFRLSRSERPLVSAKPPPRPS